MAAILRTFPAGRTEITATVPQGLAGGKIIMSGDGWPDGSYVFTLFISSDGGVTFPFQRIVTFTSPFNFPAGKSHNCVFEYKQFDIVPTHAKARVDASSQFTTTISFDPA